MCGVTELGVVFLLLEKPIKQYKASVLIAPFLKENKKNPSKWMKLLKNKPLQINVLEGGVRLTASRNQRVFHHLGGRTWASLVLSERKAAWTDPEEEGWVPSQRVCGHSPIMDFINQAVICLLWVLRQHTLLCFKTKFHKVFIFLATEKFRGTTISFS